MREIKFRAWDGLFVRQATELHLGWKTGGAEVFYEDKKYGRQRLPKHAIDLMQYTGLKDKNGKEIYEGDIMVRNKRIKYIPKNIVLSPGETIEKLRMQGNPPMAIKWSDKKMGFRAFIGNSDFPVKALDRVIGNIYENPELLKN